MPVLKTPPTYDSRSVKDWLTMAGRGEVVLPNFQRSFVWKPQQTAHYLKALLESRPTGIFLILKAANPLQFESRSLQGIDFQAEQCRELVLDGQQRLTSLWGALDGTVKRRYFIRVKNLRESDLEVEQVVWRSRSWSNPAKMCQESWIPVDILWDDPDSSQSSNPGPPSSDTIEGWCRRAAGDDWVTLFSAVMKLRERLILNPKLQYCSLDNDTDPDTAIDIFINVNRSAIKLKQVDIVIAIARADHGEDLRTRVERYLKRSSEAPHYFPPNLSRAIPDVAEWVLRIGCLKVQNDKHPEGLPPKETHYPSAVGSLFGSDQADPVARAQERDARMKQLEADLDAALQFVAHRGGATKRTLPGRPPVYVIAALQDQVRMAGEALQNDITRLLSAYVWRAFVTGRYQAQANDRLLEDFKSLRDYIRALVAWRTSGRGKPALKVPAFDEQAHPLPTSSQILRAGWIGGVSRLGRAIAAVCMEWRPFDWWSGHRLDPELVRDLEGSGKLARHYVFPPALFDGGVGANFKLGLNGVLLPRSSKHLMGLDPHDYLTSVRDNQPELDDLDIKARVGSHQIPYWTLEKDGASVGIRYDRFIKARASKVTKKMKELASI